MVQLYEGHGYGGVAWRCVAPGRRGSVLRGPELPFGMAIFASWLIEMLYVLCHLDVPYVLCTALHMYHPASNACVIHCDLDLGHDWITMLVGRRGGEGGKAGGRCWEKRGMREGGGEGEGGGAGGVLL